MDKSDVQFRRLAPGYLSISGEDRLDFIQRQSTNDLDLLRADNTVTTVLTNPAARILDVLQIFQEGEGAYGAIPLPGQAGDTSRFLKSRIFFNDHVRIEDRSADYQLLDLGGKGALKLLDAVSLPSPEPARLEIASFDGRQVIVLGQRSWAGPGFRLVLPVEAAAPLLRTLKKERVEELDETRFEIMRIEAGLPAPKAELSESYTPLEIGLRNYISDTKGCYTGQEVIARQITYDKVTRQLTGIKLDAEASAGDVVTVDGKKVGEITSSQRSPRLGAIALAVLKRPHFEPGTDIIVMRNGKTLSGTTTALPFPK